MQHYKLRMQHYKLRMQQLNVLSKTKLATIFEESNQENYDIKLYIKTKLETKLETVIEDHEDTNC